MEVILDKFNTHIFHLKWGNVSGVKNSLTINEIDRLMEDATKDGFQNLIVKIDTGFKRAVNIFEDRKFQLVDTQMMYEIAVKPPIRADVPILIPNVIFREQRQEDVAKIVNIARNTFVLDQFHSDMALEKEDCDRYYGEWARNCCEGFADGVFVLTCDDVIAGFITIHFREPKKATVGLAAIDTKYQGNGFFHYMIEKTLDYLRDRECKTLFYGTQLCNQPVLRVMSKFGGVPLYSKHVFHRMLTTSGGENEGRSVQDGFSS
ncbi:dTDP-fucosamine acetyltransferase [Lachnospiraceae bacterium]|nr:dTDP-fucosamine acetyltransferase [Lachnospiraceae bacterium]